MGLKNGFIFIEKEIFVTSFPTNLIFASSTSSADRNDPSPNLFNCARGGNSNSINGKDGFRGRSIAFLVASIAILSRFSIEDGILAAAAVVDDDARRYDDDDDDDDVDVDDDTNNVDGTNESTDDINNRKSSNVVPYMKIKPRAFD